MNCKKDILLLLLGCITFHAYAQTPTSGTCDNAVGVCSSTSYSFPAGVNAGTAATGPNYGCLTTRPNPAWFFLQMQNSGSITFTMISSPAKDIDYIIWGPFTDRFASCGTSLNASKIVSCSYSNAATETATIPSGVTGQYYILLITNYSNNATNISFAQTSGTGSSNCDILCNITGLTAAASACGVGANLGTYSVTGTINTFTPPSTGTLTISSSCGGSVSYTAPFSSSINYTLPNIAGHGDSCTITAAYSAVSTCTKLMTAATPTCCSINASSTVSVCASQILNLTATGTSGGSYYWSGPASFSSTSQNPSIANTSSSHAGTYSVYLVSGGCTTSAKSVSVTVNPKPTAKSIVHE